MLLYVFLNIFLGIKEIGLQRLHLRIQYLGNIGIVQLVIVTQVEHQPLFLRKLPDGFLQERQAFPVVIIRTFIRNIRPISSSDSSVCLFFSMKRSVSFVAIL